QATGPRPPRTPRSPAAEGRQLGDPQLDRAGGRRDASRSQVDVVHAVVPHPGRDRDRARLRELELARWVRSAPTRSAACCVRPSCPRRMRNRWKGNTAPPPPPPLTT